MLNNEFTQVMVHSGARATTSTNQTSPTSSNNNSLTKENSVWFRGDLCRDSACDLLTSSERCSFVVWRSAPEKYYLTHTDEQANIRHIPIYLIARRYFFCGEPFQSLSAIVRRFLRLSDVNEIMHSELPQSSASTSTRSSSDVSLRRIAMLPFCGLPNTDELSVERGDVLTELDRVDSEWIYVRQETTGAVGLIASQFVAAVKPEEIFECSTRVEDLPYYHSGNQQHFLKLLIRAGVGGFLVRSSTQNPQAYALLVNTGKVIEKFLVEREDGRLRLGPRLFDCFEAIIDRYCNRSISGNVRLLRAVLSEPEGESPLALVPPIYANSSFEMPSTRDVSHQSGTATIVASVQALRKSREDKTWKPCYLTLYDDPNGKCELMISDSDQAARARLVLPLEYCQLYCLHHSVFGRDGCVYLGQNDMDGQGTYLCFRPAHTHVQWMALLRPRVLWLRVGTVATQLGRPFEPPRIYDLSMMQIQVDKFKSDSLLRMDALYSASVLVNGVRICITRPLPPTAARVNQQMTIVFDANFVLMNAPSNTGSVQLTLCLSSSGKKVGGSLTKSVTATSPLYALPDDKELSDPSGESGFCFRVTRYRLRVLSAEQYTPLLALIREDQYKLCEWAGDRLSLHQRTQFAYSLWVVFLSKPRELQTMVRTIVGRTLAQPSTGSPLRSDSWTTTLLSVGIRLAACSQFEQELETILSTASSKKAVQSSDVDAVVDALRRISEPHTPAGRLLCLIGRIAKEKFPDEVHISYRILSNVYVLRFANPVLLGQNQVSGSTCQQLAKHVQAAANTATSSNFEMQQDLPHAATALRSMFQRILNCDDDLELSGVDTPLSCDHLAVVSHLLSTVMTSTTENQEKCPIPLTQPVLRILNHHAAHVI